MQAEVWIKIQAKKRYHKWQTGHVTAFKKKPDTMDNEIAVKITLDIPDETFDEPIFEAKLVLPKTTRQLPETTEIAKQVGAELSKRMGFRVKLEMPSEGDQVSP